MILISKTVHKVQLLNHNNNKVWRTIKCSNTDFIGEIEVCGLPRASDFPVGSKHTITIHVPEGVLKKCSACGREVLLFVNGECVDCRH